MSSTGIGGDNTSTTTTTSTSDDRDDDELPYHVIHPMPSLSRSYNSFTEYGIVTRWHFDEGEPFVAGDALGEIETDQGMFEIEVMEDGFVARHLVKANNKAPAGGGGGNDGDGGDRIKVGVPILVTVEEAEDVEMFRDFDPSTTRSST